jgi:hypothetical protein
MRLKTGRATLILWKAITKSVPRLTINPIIMARLFIFTLLLAAAVVES